MRIMKKDQIAQKSNIKECKKKMKVRKKKMKVRKKENERTAHKRESTKIREQRKNETSVINIFLHKMSWIRGLQ